MYWQGCGEKGTLIHCWWECKLVQPLEKTLETFQKFEHRPAMIQPSHTWGYTQRNATQVTPGATAQPYLLQRYSQ
jgi:hypothetical protein